MGMEDRKKSPKREEIIEIAGRLFYENGYGATGIQQIIREANIAKGTFYSHFKSKEELGVAWLQRRHIEWNSWLEEALTKAPSPTKKVAAIFDFLESWLIDSEFRGCAFLNTAAETPDASNPMRDQVASHKRSLHELFQSLTIAAFQPPKSKNSEIAENVGSTLFLLFEGALVESQNFRQTWPVQIAKKQAHKLLNPN